eukprot:gene10000-13455_t
MSNTCNYKCKSDSRVYVFGNNADGQTGISNGEDMVSIPTAITYIDATHISKIITNQNQTIFIMNNGDLFTCGTNDNNELCRSGKRSTLLHVDSLETFQIFEGTLGQSFAMILSNDAKVLGWGKNDLGQLGNGNREDKLKPKLNTNINEYIIQIASGAHHSVILSKNGNIFTFGGNRKGQLGDGQLTSTTSPIQLLSLRHRPVISVTCGENHTMVLTAGGNVYSWGDNSNGQLGLSDTTSRLRPELIKSLRSVKPIKISAGKQHSSVVTDSGLLFTFGSNSSGQCGAEDSSVRSVLTPTVVDRIRDDWAFDVACGSAHTLVLCGPRGSNYSSLTLSNEIMTKVYVMGLNSSGQLGLGHTRGVTTPTMLPLSQEERVVGISSGPLSMHSFVITGNQTLDYFAFRKSLPILTRELIFEACNHYQVSHVHTLQSATDNDRKYNAENELKVLNSIREMIASSYSSISVLNASFLDRSHTGHNSLCVDLQAVRDAYEFIMSTESSNPLIVTTLGRATLHLADQLKDCPVDDPENLSVFLIVLENPLLLRTSTFHIAIERVINSVLGLPKYYRLMLFKWLKSYPSEFFGRIVQVMQGFLTEILTNKTLRIDFTPVVMVLETLYQCNLEVQILPEHVFYNSNVAKSIDPREEWIKLQQASSESTVFNFCSYLFLLEDYQKYALLQHDFVIQKSLQHNKYNHYLKEAIVIVDPRNGAVTIQTNQNIPRGLSLVMDSMSRIGLYCKICVDRETLLIDLINSLKEIIDKDPNILRLPLKVEFKNELGVDQGGITKELFTLAIRDIIATGKVVSPVNNDRVVWFSNSTPINSSPETVEMVDESSKKKNSKNYSLEYYLGLIVGLAAYNGVFIDIPLPPSIYKLMIGKQLSLSDLYAVDNQLAKGLQSLLDFEQGEGSLEEVFGTTFSASANPLIQSSLSSMSSSMMSHQQDNQHYIENNIHFFEEYSNTLNNNSSTDLKFIDLIPNGSDVYVTRGNRHEFVRLFIQHTLYNCCQNQIDDYIQGLQVLFNSRLLKHFSHNELEHSLCGSTEIGDLSELRIRTIYKGVYNDEHYIINWFWDVLSSLSGENKRKFLQFVTGSERVPVGGISKLGLIIQSTAQDSTALPTSHTCFNILDLPSTYSSKDQLENRLKIALEYGEGFGLI